MVHCCCGATANESGGLLYPNFVETLLAIQPMYWTRLVGGTLYLVGFVIQAWNLVMTAEAFPAPMITEFPIDA